MVRTNKGAALVLTLWIMLALIVLAGGIAMMSRTETEISRNYADVIRCKWAARAGMHCAIQKINTLLQDQNIYLGEDPYVVSSDDSDVAVDLGGYTFSATVQDEAGKVDINTASADILTALFGSSDISDCIIDWRDADDTPGPQGAETDYYSTLTPPYKCRNGAFQTPGEVFLVRGITQDLLSAPPQDGTVALVDLITVYTPKVQPQASSSSSTVNIQTANNSELQRVLGDVLNSRDIDAIVSYRTRRAFTNAAQVVNVPGLSRTKIEQIYNRLTVTSNSGNGGTGSTGSGSSTSTAAGLVNINTAPVEVLSVQPGLDQTIAQAIIEYRKENGAFDNVGGLLTISDVTNAAFVSAAPHFTVKSRVFKIISTGSFAATGASAVITCVVEIGNDGQAQIRYWQE